MPPFHSMPPFSSIYNGSYMNSAVVWQANATDKSTTEAAKLLRSADGYILKSWDPVRFPKRHCFLDNVKRYFHLMHQPNALSVILHPLHHHLVRHNTAIFRDYTPSSKPIKVNWITFTNI
jgi:hypothetical protein